MPGEGMVMPGAYIADGVVVESSVSIGPNAVVLAAPTQSGSQTTLRSGCEIGANATILPEVEIGQGAVVGPGSVVANSVPPLAVVEGNPAHIVGYVDIVPDDEWSPFGPRSITGAETESPGRDRS